MFERSSTDPNTCIQYRTGDLSLTAQSVAPRADEMPQAPTVMGGESPYSRRPWKQLCADRIGESRVFRVTTERSWLAVRALTPLPPKKPCSIAEHCPKFSCGCFVRYRPCEDDTDIDSPGAQTPLEGNKQGIVYQGHYQKPPM